MKKEIVIIYLKEKIIVFHVKDLFFNNNNLKFLNKVVVTKKYR